MSPLWSRVLSRCCAWPISPCKPLAVNRWFLALDQGFEAAAMHLYLAYQHFNADVGLVTRDPSVSPNGKLKNVPVSIDDFDLIYSGGRIYF